MPEPDVDVAACARRLAAAPDEDAAADALVERLSRRLALDGRLKARYTASWAPKPGEPPLPPADASDLAEAFLGRAEAFARRGRRGEALKALNGAFFLLGPDPGPDRRRGAAEALLARLSA